MLQQLFYLRVFLKRFQVVNIDFGTGILLHQLNGILNFTQTTLPQNIELSKTNVFGFEHTKMNGWKTFWRHNRCRVRTNRLLGNKNTAGVHTQMARKTVNQFTVLQYQFPNIIKTAEIFYLLQFFNFVRRQTKHFSQLANY